MRRGRERTAFALFVFAATCAGCTWLISFDEVAPPAPAPGDAEAADPTDAAPRALPTDATADGATDAIDLATLTSCEGRASGLYCGNNQISDYPGSRDDLVTCDGGRVVQVVECERGSGCVRMPNPRPDQCDACWRLADGYWCGRDMAGWSTENADLRVQCQAGGLVGIVPCAARCVSNGARSTCQ